MFSNKKIIVSIILAGVLLGGGAFVASRDLDKGQVNANRDIVKDTSDFFSIQHSSISEDTDGDGLKDWEESLWGTNVNEVDSDGDGTLDGDEVAVGRDPSKAGPDDELEPKPSTHGVAQGLRGEDLTATGEFAVDFFARYFSAVNDGNLSATESEGIQQSVLNSFLREQQAYKGFPEFLSKDITVVESSKTNIKNYGNEIAAVLTSYGRGLGEHPVDLLVQTVENRDNNKASDLLTWSREYQEAAIDLSKIKTPQSLLSLHLDLTNNLFNTGKNLETLSDILEDPISALASLSLFFDNSDLLSASVGNLKEALIRNDISYSSTESGFALLQI